METRADPRYSRSFAVGLFQLETCGDRTDLYLPSTALHVPVVLSTFGDHTLHHLFPTVDHAYHRHLYSVLAQTCNEFGVRFEFVSQWQAVKGFFKELKRTEALQWRRRLGGKGEVGGWVDEKRGFKNDPTV